MKYVFTALIAVVAVILLAAPVTADWDPLTDPNDPSKIINHKMHWPQLPDLQTGLNVRATSQPPIDPQPGIVVGKVLADDFRCTETGPITGIHIWGSWLNDVLPENDDTANGTGSFADPGNVAFRLSLHKNVPDDPAEPDDFSYPEPEFWHRWFGPNEFRWRGPEDATEGFYDPNQQEIIGFDTQVYQYNFFLDPSEAPPQQAGEIYWLDVTAVPLGPGPAGTTQEPLFGWKSTHPEQHFMDDAVYGHMTVDAAGNLMPMNDWLPLKYPFGHDYETQTMDLAFVITPEPGTIVMLIGAGLIGLVAFARRRRKS